MLDRSGMMVHYRAYEQASSRKARPSLQMMAEGISLRAMTRLTDISRTTLIKLLEDAGQAFSEYQDRVLVACLASASRLMRHGPFATQSKRMFRPRKQPQKGLATFGRGWGLMPTRNLLRLGMSAPATAKRL